MEFLRDTAIQAIVGLFGVGLSIWFFLVQRIKRTIVYYISIDEPYVDFYARSLPISENSDFFEDALKLKGLRLALINFKNIGNASISADEYETEITFKFDEQVKVAFAKIPLSRPVSIKDTIQPNVDNNSVKIPKTLLNPKDEFILAVGYFSEESRLPTPVCRIKGIPDLQRVGYRKRYITALQIFMAVASVLGILTTEAPSLELLYMYNLVNSSYLLMDKVFKTLPKGEGLPSESIFELAIPPSKQVTHRLT